MDYTAIIKQVGNWWYGWIEEVPAIDFYKKDAIDAAGRDYKETTIAV